VKVEGFEVLHGVGSHQGYSGHLAAVAVRVPALVPGFSPRELAFLKYYCADMVGKTRAFDSVQYSLCYCQLTTVTLASGFMVDYLA
jgi:hypothetical protein